jgi:hypothetical protein
MLWKAGWRSGVDRESPAISCPLPERRYSCYPNPAQRGRPSSPGPPSLLPKCRQHPPPSNNPRQPRPAVREIERPRAQRPSAPARSHPPQPHFRLTSPASLRPPHHSRLHRPASPGPASPLPAGGCTEPRRRGQVRYTGVHVSGESLVPLGSGGMPRGMRRFPLSFYRISRPADTVAPGPGAFGCGQSPRSRPTRFRTPGELLSKSVPFENHVGNLAGRSAADVCSKDTPGHRVRQAFRPMG